MACVGEKRKKIYTVMPCTIYWPLMFILCELPLPMHTVGNKLWALVSLLNSTRREEVMVAQLGIGSTWHIDICCVGQHLLLAFFSQNDNFVNEELSTFHLQGMLCDMIATDPRRVLSIFTFIASIGLASWYKFCYFDCHTTEVSLLVFNMYHS